MLDAKKKNVALEAIVDALIMRQNEIIAVNQLDLMRSQNSGLSASVLKRLVFDSAKINDAIAGIHSLIAMPGCKSQH